MDPPSSSQHTFIAETGKPSQRRRKARLACNPCRQRKTGCDGHKPVCSACSQRGWEDKCSWQDSVMQNNSALSLVDLDRRLQRLESDAKVDSEPPRRRGLDPMSPGAHSESSKSTQDRDAVSPDGAYGRGALMRGETTVAGMSSNSTFMRQAVDAASPEAADDLRSEPLVPNILGFSLNNVYETAFGDFDLQRQAIVLPQRSFASALLGWYWKYVNSIFPILHRPTFMAEYEQLWQSNIYGHQLEELVFHATLNMVLALGCQRNEGISLNQREYQADEFYRRSQRLISIESLDTSSLAIVQLLLLRTLYLYFAHRADRCWLMSGAAIRVAIGMGLNTAASRGVMTQLEREMRRRVWHGGCMILDTIISSTFGRPTLILKQFNQVPVPLAIDDEHLSTTEEGRQPEGIPSRLALCAYTSSKGLDIMDDMRQIVFATRLKASHAQNMEPPGPDPSVVLRINSKLDDLLNGVPEHLRVDADYASLGLNDEDAECFRGQSEVFRARCLFVRLLLLRPSVLAEVHRWAAMPTPRAGRVSSSARLQERFHAEICSLCLATVHAVLQDIHDSMETRKQSPAWYALQFTFSAATVLIVATLAPNLGVRLDQEPARSSWDRVLRIFQFYKAYLPSAAKGIEVLERFRLAIGSRMAAQQGGNSTVISPDSASFVSSYLPMEQQHHGFPQVGAASDGQHAFGYGAAPNSAAGGAGSMTSFSGPGPGPEPVPGQGGPMPDVPMEGFEEILASTSLDQAWLSNQDFGHNDWLLNLSGQGPHHQHQQYQ
ncbi:fungal-specific transcription factor domain-containing protein [Apodospora peruviana]|uniref:Fungal-specific transcription factor domain-containing protein n=1 Tax=Apodospora peruviana TaxID=516989 RepID=A0AAE0IDG2_9PEZI|nr:fungal-specific transcription factor domain-containing protein [Apodospora peruviana]